MRAKIIHIAALLVLLISLLGTAVPAAASETADWTVMVYMAGDNDLSGSVMAELDEMKTVGSTDNVKIVALADLQGTLPSDKTALYLIEQGQLTSMTESATFITDDELNMGDPTVLTAFAGWAKAAYPANNYALILWDHGTGFRSGSGIPDTRGICFDETSNHDYLTMQELKDALDNIKVNLGKNLDILAMDADLMMMSEVAGQVSGCVDYMVGSEDAMIVAGFPYDDIFSALTSPTHVMTPVELATTITGKFKDYCLNDNNDTGDKWTISAVALPFKPDLATAFTNFANALVDSGDKTRVQAARNAAASFTDTDFIDLYDFAAKVQAEFTGSDAASKAGALMEKFTSQATRCVIDSYAGPGCLGAHGLSIYFPEAPPIDSVYSGLRFMDTLWDEFLNWQLGLETIADWTFMVYMAADNSLYEAALKDLNEMEAAGSTDKVNIVALVDLKGPNNTSLYRIEREDPPTPNLISTPITAPFIPADNELNTGDYQNLINFVDWSTANYPARHYALVLWNHGTGWRTLGIPPEITTKWICIDETSSNSYITTPQLGTAMRSIAQSIDRPIDILDFDACVMQMAEVAWEIGGGNLAQIMIGSEEVVPADGLPYDTVLDGLVNNPSQSPEAFSADIVDKYIASYPGSYGLTLSAIHLGKISGLGNALNAFSTALQSENYRTAAGEARAAVEYYDDSTFIDLYDFAYRIKSNIPGLTEQADALISAVDEMVFAGGDHSFRPNSHGLSIYFPGSGTLDSTYLALAFASANWDDFLTWYLNDPATTALNIRVRLQGDSRPDSGWNIPLKVKLFTPNPTAPVDVLTATPVYEFDLDTIKSGTAPDITALARISAVIPGTYDISVCSPYTLTNVRRNVDATIPRSVSPVEVDMGVLLEGNAKNDDHIIDISDFGLLSAAFGSSSGGDRWNEAADFDRNGKVNIADFGLLAVNYAKTAPIEVP